MPAISPIVHSPLGQRQAEIHDSDAPAAVDHDVRWLEIAMQYAAVMSGRQPGAELPGDIKCLLGRQRPMRRNSDSSVSPSTSSIETYHQPSASPMSYTRHTFGWLSCERVAPRW